MSETVATRRTKGIVQKTDQPVLLVIVDIQEDLVGLFPLFQGLWKRTREGSGDQLTVETSRKQSLRCILQKEKYDKVYVSF